ncbi:DUF3127 domain-containing protein [Flavobacterium branchiophilum]|uniref:DUF3127 domain-containing protein n=2 Tax=Flavobacterium branchiophilum TaxID=55197 RepID=G2Z685_FLABF|nr:DUF3127 domain-containing protein [Flavobacterium branchiophilum]PDS25392.1 DUF3127 domain-containing protein [Flavobacterium branchiophilum]CCB70905.1 Protein of unknown function [Flavobacterium branchiophilum FL-15]
MEVIGKIKVINPEQQVSASFRKREIVVATEEQYPQYISINFVQDKCDTLNNFQIGEDVKVSINLRGREWVNPQGEVKYFNDIQGWRIERLAAPGAPAPPQYQQQAPPQYQQQAPAQQFQQAPPQAQTFPPVTNFTEEEHDDLPF